MVGRGDDAGERRKCAIARSDIARSGQANKIITRLERLSHLVQEVGECEDPLEVVECASPGSSAYKKQLKRANHHLKFFQAVN